MRGIEKSIKHVQSKLDYLSDIIGIQMDSEKIEYVLCVYDKGLFIPHKGSVPNFL
jgi:hypothetical protein